MDPKYREDLALETTINRMRQIYCKNAVITGKMVDDKDSKGKKIRIPEGKIEVCKNKRRDNSAYCQECSDKINE